MRRGAAPAKLNLALVVGPRRSDGRHELLTVYQRVALTDRISVGRADELTVRGFPGDTLVRHALSELGGRFEATIRKRIPVAAGLGGGSSDAATSLRLANSLLEAPLAEDRLNEIAARLGADVPYFLRDGPALGSGDGTNLEPIELPQDYWVVLVLPHGVVKRSTGAVYEEFDARRGERGFEDRAAALREAIARVRSPRDLAELPANDLASSPLADELRSLGAFRADVSGAGPVVYGLFLHGEPARAAQRRLARGARTWLTAPTWYR